MVWKSTSDLTTEAVTDQVLIAAPGAKKQIVVFGVHISADIKEVVQLRSAGTDQLWVLYAGADNPEDHTAGHPLFRCNTNEALTLTTDGAGNTFVAVTYRIEDDVTG